MKIHTITSYISLILIFVLMCILRLWYSMFIFIGFGLILTIIVRKKTFCIAFCPLGTMQDLTHTQSKKPAKRFKINLVFKWLIYSMFICTIAFIMLKHYPNGATLWFWMLRFMLVVFATAIILQSIYAKRTWCSAACPVGAIMSWELKAIRHISKAVKKRT